MLLVQRAVGLWRSMQTALYRSWQRKPYPWNAWTFRYSILHTSFLDCLLGSVEGLIRENGCPCMLSIIYTGSGRMIILWYPLFIQDRKLQIIYYSTTSRAYSVVYMLSWDKILKSDPHPAFVTAAKKHTLTDQKVLNLTARWSCMKFTLTQPEGMRLHPLPLHNSWSIYTNFRSSSTSPGGQTRAREMPAAAGLSKHGRGQSRSQHWHRAVWSNGKGTGRIRWAFVVDVCVFCMFYWSFLLLHCAI